MERFEFLESIPSRLIVPGNFVASVALDEEMYALSRERGFQHQRIQTELLLVVQVDVAFRSSDAACLVFDNFEHAVNFGQAIDSTSQAQLRALPNAAGDDAHRRARAIGRVTHANPRVQNSWTTGPLSCGTERNGSSSIIKNYN